MNDRDDPKPEPNGPWKPDYKAPKGTAARHAEAYRARAGIVGRLLTCICTWPLDEDSATISQHSEFCPVELAAKREDLAKREEINVQDG